MMIISLIPLQVFAEEVIQAEPTIENITEVSDESSEGKEKEVVEPVVEQEGEEFSFSMFSAAKKDDRDEEEILPVVDETTIYQDNGLVPTNCDQTEWHWVINGLDSDAPEEITVHFASGDVVVPLEKVTGGTAHYRLASHLGDVLVAPGATAEYEGEYIRFNLSHGPCVVPLEISKTAGTSYEVEWTWGIEKTADEDDLGLIEKGEIATVTYNVTVDASSEEINHVISGTITITNPASNPAAIIGSIEDELDETGVIDIECGDDFELPYELAAGATLECTYSEDVDDQDDGLNTVTVITTGAVLGGEATADVVWSEPENVIDECITVSDTNPQGPQDAEVCADDLDDNGEFEFTYDITFSKDQATDVVWACGQDEYENIASFVTNDSGADDDDSWTVEGEITCFCSLSQGYWFAKPKVAWNPVLSLGGKTYTKTEGTNIWNTSNKGGISTAKQGFTQYAAIMLSAKLYGTEGDIPAELQAKLNVINSYFASKVKMTTSNYNKAPFTEDAAVKAAAGYIGNWIDENHCE
jgi:hypothetical protein